MEYEDHLFACQTRLTRAVVLAAATPTPAHRDLRDLWLDEVVDGIAVLCELSTWCWPAHERGCAAAETVVPDPESPFLDLGAGEVAAQLAWADHVLGRLLDDRAPGLRERMRHEVQQRVLGPFLERDDWHWLGLDGHVHNWCPWICGNVVAAALVFGDDDANRARILTKAVDGIDRYVASLPDDGSIDEGYEYWWNGACRALEALELIEHAAGNSIDAAQLPVVRRTIAFPHLMHLGGDWYLNLADARARPPHDQPWQVLHRWARRIGDNDALAHAAANRRPGQPIVSAYEGLGRVVSALLDNDWTSAEPRPSPLLTSVWLPGTEVGLAREAAGSSTGLTLAIKGGHNDENHNHNDVGTVIVAVDGVPVLVDAGRPTYTAQTFGPDRYDIWTMQSTWHNVPEVRGTPQGQGENFRARDVHITDTVERFTLQLDLSPAYPVDDLLRWWRTAELDRKEHRVTIRDAWEFASPPSGGSGTTLHYLLPGEVHLPGPGEARARPPNSSRGVRLTWAFSAEPETPARDDVAAATTTVRTLDDPMHADIWGQYLTRLELHLPPTARGALTLTVEAMA
jgi:hypothetical protein